MDFLYTGYDIIFSFLDRGGNVIVVIAWVIFVMWTLILERVMYLRTEHPRRVRDSLAAWEARPDPDSWHSERIHDAMVSRLGLRLHRGIPMIRTLAAICPLLGLLGTVTGMVIIFDVMAAMGTSSPRAVASGVAKATMTTMAGMVGALSGVFPAFLLARYVRQETELLRVGSRVSESIRVPATSNVPPLLRNAAAVCMAFVITMGLVVLMERLIETGEKALTESAAVILVDFIRVKPQETVQRKDAKPDKPPPPEVEPQELPPPDQADLNPEAGSINIGSMSAPRDGVGITVSGVSDFSLQDADYMPIVKVLPIYPRRAEARGMEGWVLVRFTITTTGAVKDIEVVESTHAVFERAAVQAASKFKYKPRVVDGTPVEVTGVLHYIQFEIEEDA
jgi:TonB family protein